MKTAEPDPRDERTPLPRRPEEAGGRYHDVVYSASEESRYPQGRAQDPQPFTNLRHIRG